jgi:hypothetical protein
VREVKKKILVIALAVAMLALPMISTVQARGSRRPTEIYDDQRAYGSIRTYVPFEAKVWKWGSMQFGRYPAYCPMLVIQWDTDNVPPQSRSGTAEYTVSYAINTETLKGVVNLKCRVTLGASTPDTSDDGTFVGNMLWIGDLVLGDETTPAPNAVIPNFGGGTFAWYTYWRGTGAYAGWTITQNMQFEAGSPLPVSIENYLIKPID